MKEGNDYEKQKNTLKLINNEFLNCNDPHEKIDLKACDVCGKIVAIDQFGFGKCENCGWIQDPNLIEMPDKVMYPNRISLNKARFLYKQGKKLEPDIDDFIAGLMMYSEMEFWYNNKNYGVCHANNQIEFFEDKNESSLQVYANTSEFREKANIDGKLLKDIWKDVVKADYMQG